MTYEELLEKYKLEPQCLGGIGDGWVPLVETLIKDLLAMGWNREVGQIKEKFGLLRVYIGEGTKAMFDRINKAEEDSAYICEECGGEGKLRDTRWVRTLCDSCFRH
jgi:hypothetical protein